MMNSRCGRNQLPVCGPTLPDTFVLSHLHQGKNWWLHTGNRKMLHTPEPLRTRGCRAGNINGTVPSPLLFVYQYWHEVWYELVWDEACRVMNRATVLLCVGSCRLGQWRLSCRFWEGHFGSELRGHRLIKWCDWRRARGFKPDTISTPWPHSRRSSIWIAELTIHPLNTGGWIRELEGHLIRERSESLLGDPCIWQPQEFRSLF